MKRMIEIKIRNNIVCINGIEIEKQDLSEATPKIGFFLYYMDRTIVKDR